MFQWAFFIVKYMCVLPMILHLKADEYISKDLKTSHPELFCKMCDDHLIHVLTKETNRYACQKNIHDASVSMAEWMILLVLFC